MRAGRAKRRRTRERNANRRVTTTVPTKWGGWESAGRFCCVWLGPGLGPSVWASALCLSSGLARAGPGRQYGRRRRKIDNFTYSPAPKRPTGAKVAKMGQLGMVWVSFWVSFWTAIQIDNFWPIPTPSPHHPRRAFRCQGLVWKSGSSPCCVGAGICLLHQEALVDNASATCSLSNPHLHWSSLCASPQLLAYGL